MDADGTDQTRLSASRYIPLAWSPTGLELAVAAGRQLAVLAADGSGAATVVTHEPRPIGISSVSWTPDGSYLHYVAALPSNDRELYSMLSNGRDVRQLTDNGVDDFDPAVAPDGRRLALDRGGPRAGLYLMDAAGRGVRRLTRLDDSQPAWSPDGTRLAFVRTTRRGSALDVLDLRRRTIRRLVARVDASAAPSWSSTGWIAYAAGGGVVRAVRPDGRGGHVVVRSGSFPAWSPGGRLLAYVRESGNGSAFALAIVTAHGAAVRTLVPHALSSRAAWSPDGRRLVYSTGVLFSIPAGGGAPRQLEDGPGFSDEPAWSRR